MKLDNSMNGHVESRQRGKRTALKLDNSTYGQRVESRQHGKRRELEEDNSETRLHAESDQYCTLTTLRAD